MPGVLIAVQFLYAEPSRVFRPVFNTQAGSVSGAHGGRDLCT